MRRRVQFTTVFIALFSSFAAFSQTLPEGIRKVTSIEGITEYTLPNGLRVLLFPDTSKPKVTVNITYLVGSRHEGYGETGMAHLLEHMNFIQTKTRKNMKQELTDHGANMNGTTSWDRTNYFETLNATDENLRWALEFEADRMVNTRIEKALLDTEMTVVRNEFESGENSPDNILMQRVLETAFLWHNYGHLPIGNRSDIERVPIERLAAFYQKFYQPDNAILVVAGRFDEAKTLEWIAATVGKVPRPQRKLEQTYTVEPTQDGERTVTLRRVGDTQSVVMMYHMPAATHPDSAALDVMTGVLGDTPSGRLYKALVDNKKAVSASMDTISLHDPGVMIASVRLRQEQSLDDARKILVDTVEGLVKEPPTKEEVERVKTKFLKQIELYFADSQQVALALSETAADGDWRLLFLGRDELKKVTEQDVLRVAKAYLKPSNRTIGQFIPEKTPDRAEIPETPDLTARFKDFKGGEAVAEGEVFDPSPANIEGRVIRTTLPNGMKLVMLPKKTRGGTVSMFMTFRFGDEKSLFGKSPAAQMTGAMLMRGTKNKSRQQIQDAADKLKAQVNVGGGANNASATIQTISANLAGAMRLAAEILREPSFPDSEFETIRQQRIASMEQGKSDPQTLAVVTLQRRLVDYPRGDLRHVSTADEQIEDFKKVTIDEARKFYQEFYGISEGELAVSGQFDPQEVQKLATELFANWKAPVPYKRLLTPYRKAEVANQKIETPDKQNAMFLAGMNTKMSDEDADYPAALLANYILGGSFSARLVTRIRHKEGLSYGVQSSLGAPTKDDGGTFMGLAISAPQNTPKVEESFRDEIAKTLKDGFTDEEVSAAKKAWLQERFVQRSQDQTMASMLTARARFDRTLKFDEALEKQVEGLTTAQVSDALRKHVDPAAMIYVKAGDFKKAGVYQ
jgi:zinc protease